MSSRPNFRLGFFLSKRCAASWCAPHGSAATCAGSPSCPIRLPAKVRPCRAAALDNGGIVLKHDSPYSAPEGGLADRWKARTDKVESHFHRSVVSSDTTVLHMSQPKGPFLRNRVY